MYFNRRTFPFTQARGGGEGGRGQASETSVGWGGKRVLPRPFLSMPNALLMPPALLQYFEELHRLLPRPPAAVFVASDNPRISEEVAAEDARRRWGAGVAAPRIFTSDGAAARFRTAHGSHTVAAEGACSSTGRCILAYTDVVAYNEKVRRGVGRREEGEK